ncbi:hypothetical protein NDU88_002754 [Pleurodeles waltl]|uniref:Uncharacterized protein n=1 Tax=Pleurodeles waltl TaxID=8319 RepID=A0AAV7TLJ5_PLEWA|nr:hypothetical protein NDU88_002754 [Pleurodeles waltl]
MMRILIKYAQSDRDKVLGKIDSLTKDIDGFTDKKIVESLNKAMEERLGKMEDEIVQKKKRKFNRDRIDYETVQIYTYAKKIDFWRNQRIRETADPITDHGEVPDQEEEAETEETRGEKKLTQKGTRN